MSEDGVLDEETSPLVYGPVNKQRWIYAASKQLLDRVIYAYGVRDNLDYTLFRPFNFIGPNLDNVEEPKEGSSRVFTQFLSNVLYKRPIKLVDGGQQKRSFTYIDDAVEALLTILENKDECASRRIFNIGNPDNCVSIRDLAERTIRIAQEFPVLRENAKATQIVEVAAGEYYGKYYQDIQVRVPAIEAARKYLGWKPTTDMDTAIRRTIEYYVNQEGFGDRARATTRRGAMAHRNVVSAGCCGSSWGRLGSRPCPCVPLVDPDEGRYAEIPREMAVTGDWITPRLDGLKYFEKPPLQYWATAAAYSVFGFSEWTARLWTVGWDFCAYRWSSAGPAVSTGTARVGSLSGPGGESIL